jgi:hypothetical protein
MGIKRMGSEKASRTSSSIFVLDREATALSLLTTILENKDLKNTNKRRIKIPITILLKLIPKTPSFQIEVTIFKKLSIRHDINLFVKYFVDIYIDYKKLNISLPTPSISSSGSM